MRLLGGASVDHQGKQGFSLLSQRPLLSIVLCFLSTDAMQPTSFLLLLPRLPCPDVISLLLPAEARQHCPLCCVMEGWSPSSDSDMTSFWGSGRA